MRSRHLFSALTASLLLASCGSDGSTGPDTKPPGVVADLAVAAVTDTSVTLAWTAPGDDGDKGTAAAYDIRFSQALITPATWDADTPVEGEPAPLVAGSPESLEVTVLTGAPGRLSGSAQQPTYYFALRAFDEAENRSGISNVASSDLLDSTPPAAIDDLRLASFTDSSLTVEWTTPGDDGYGGRATVYDLRYALTVITEATWPQAMPVSGVGEPMQVYTTHSALIPGLDSGVPVYVAVRTADERGNWSGLSNVLSAAPFEDAVVTIPDPGLRAGIRAQLGKATGDLHVSDMITLQSLNFPNAGITDLTGLESCYNLHTLILNGNHVASPDPVAGLTTLRFLNLRGNKLIDVSPLDGLLNLEFLDLSQNEISDLSSLTGLTSLVEFHALDNNIVNASSVARMVNLEILDLRSNAIAGLPALGGLSKLTQLLIGDNQISNIAPLADLTALTSLSMPANTVASVTALSGLTGLRSINMSDNQITGLEGLSGLVHLESLTAHDNHISDLSPLAGLHQLNRIVLYNNTIDSISSLADLTLVRDLDCSGTGVSDIAAVETMTGLQNLTLSQTPVVDLAPAVNNAEFAGGDELWVVDCDSLSTESLETHIPALEARGVVVHTTPPQ